MSNPAARKPAVSFIFITLVLSIVGFGLLIPVMPDLIKEFHHGDFEGAADTLKWIVMIYAVMQFICSPILGSLSDRFGRRRIILIATAGSAIDYVIMASAPTLGWFFVARIIAGSTAGVLATANAYIADVTPPEKRAQSFGLLGAAFGIGFIIGPALGGLLGKISLHLPFWFAAGCSAANWIYGYFVLPESLKPENRRAFNWKRANPIGAFYSMKRFPAVLGLVWCFFIITFAQVMLQSTWALYTEKRYGWDPLQIGLSLMFVGVATGLVQALLVKRIVPKLGDTRAVVVGMCISVVAFVGYGLAPYGWVIYAVICVGCFAGIAGPALQSYTTKHVPANEQGAVQGVFSGLQSLASIPAPFVGLSSFGWAIGTSNAVQLPWIFATLNGPATRLLTWLAPLRHPGIAFFESSALSALALYLAIRSFRRDAKVYKPAVSTGAVS